MTATLTNAAHAIDFDIAFTFTGDNIKAQPELSPYADLFMDENGKLYTSISSGWELSTDYGSFEGVFHPSQCFSDSMLEAMRAERPGASWMSVVVSTDDYDNPAGWALLVTK